jgi:hypothetical protein
MLVMSVVLLERILGLVRDGIIGDGMFTLRLEGGYFAVEFCVYAIVGDGIVC